MKSRICFSFFFMSSFLPIINSIAYYSQDHIQQDRYLNEHFFHNKKNGVFVDIGAYDGITFSNSFFFEKELGWTGVCFEPLPSIFEDLKLNRTCICLNGCVVNSNEDNVSFLEVSGYSQMLSGRLDMYDSRHLQRIKDEVVAFGGSYEVITVSCYTLNKVLSYYGLFDIDFLSIDTEGGELDILRSIDFDRFCIKAITVENVYYGNEIRLFLEEMGYVFITRLGDTDEVYVLKDLL